MTETMSAPPLPIDDEGKIFRVKSDSVAQSVASAIAHAIYAERQIVLRAIGASAINQAVKAFTIARGYTSTRGLDIAMKTGFATVDGNKGEVTAIQFYVFVL